MSNGTLAAAILSGSSASSFSDPGSKQAVYMVVVLGFVAATSIVVSDFSVSLSLGRISDPLLDSVSSVRACSSL